MNTTHSPEFTLSPCDRAQDTIFSLQELEPVSAEAQTFLALHLVTCEDCQAYQQTLMHLSASMMDLNDEPVPAGLADRIMVQVAQTSTESTGTLIQTNRFQWKKMMPVAAAALLLVVAIPLVSRQFGSEPSGSVANQTTGKPAQTIAMQNGTSDELIMQEANQTQNKAVVETPEPEVAPKPAVDKTPDAGQDVVQPHKGQDDRNRMTVQKLPAVVAQAPVKAPVQAAKPLPAQASTPVDETQLAYGGSMNEAYASDNEGDTYYDPVSNLVGF